MGGGAGGALSLSARGRRRGGAGAPYRLLRAAWGRRWPCGGDQQAELCDGVEDGAGAQQGKGAEAPGRRGVEDDEQGVAQQQGGHGEKGAVQAAASAPQAGHGVGFEGGGHGQGGGQDVHERRGERGGEDGQRQAEEHAARAHDGCQGRGGLRAPAVEQAGQGYGAGDDEGYAHGDGEPAGRFGAHREEDAEAQHAQGAHEAVAEKSVHGSWFL